MPSKDGFSLRVVVAGEALPETELNGKAYIAAALGKEYELAITAPNDGRRHLFVGSVDGLSIMDGQRASSDSAGYVIDGDGREHRIPGFRLNDRDVAKFVFMRAGQSYAAQMAKPENVGVLAFRIWSERPRTVHRASLCDSQVMRGGGAESFGLAGKGCGVGHDAGTGFGEKTEHRVHQTHFDRNRLECELMLEYATAKNLRKAGIPVPKKGSPLGNVSPFADRAPGSGCTPPNGWTGEKPRCETREASKGPRRKAATSKR